MVVKNEHESRLQLEKPTIKGKPLFLLTIFICQNLNKVLKS